MTQAQIAAARESASKSRINSELVKNGISWDTFRNAFHGPQMNFQSMEQYIRQIIQMCVLPVAVATGTQVINDFNKKILILSAIMVQEIYIDNLLVQLLEVRSKIN